MCHSNQLLVVHRRNRQHRSRSFAVARVSVAVLFTFLLLPGCGKQQDVKVIKLGHALDQSHPVHLAMQFMGDQLAQASQGTMRIDIYPSQQLGTERELLELLQIGSLGMTKVSSSVLEGFEPSFRVFGLPYLFRDDRHRFAVLEGDVGKKILLSAERFNLRGLAYYDAGSRSFYTKDRPIEAPEDLEGMKIRTQESPVAIRMVRAMGGAATPIAWGELYTALQQGIVDGAENNPPSFYLSRHYEIARYYSLDEHTSVPDVLLISTRVWSGLSPQQRAWVQEAANASAEYEKRLWKKAEEDALAAVQADGVTVIRPDKKPFADAVQGLYEEFRSEPVVYNLIQEVRAVAAPADSLAHAAQ